MDKTLTRETVLVDLRMAHEELFNFLMENIDSPSWRILKRHDNHLFNLELKLIKLNTNNMNIIHDAHNKVIEARKVLKKVKKERAKNQYKRVQIDSKTYKEVLIKK